MIGYAGYCKGQGFETYTVVAVGVNKLMMCTHDLPWCKCSCWRGGFLVLSIRFRDPTPATVYPAPTHAEETEVVDAAVAPRMDLIA
jgi:hypothetical protein